MKINYVLYKVPITGYHSGDWENIFLMIFMLISFLVSFNCFNSVHANQICVLPILYYGRDNKEWC